MFDPFAHVPPQILEAARQRGIALHKRFSRAFFAQAGLCPYPDVIPEYAGHCKSQDDWFDRAKPKPVHVEQKDVNLELGIAGCADFLCLYGTQETLTLGDYKSYWPEGETDGAQLWAYGTMPKFKDAKKKLNVYSDPNGGPAKEVWRTPNPVDQACFMNALQWLKCQEAIERWRAGK
jgi:hypothetical protein